MHASTDCRECRREEVEALAVVALVVVAGVSYAVGHLRGQKKGQENLLVTLDRARRIAQQQTKEQ